MADISLVNRDSNHSEIPSSIKNLSPIWRLIFAITLGLSVVPFWLGKYFPALDLPELLASVWIMRNYNNPLYDYNQFYTLRIDAAYGYWGGHLPIYLLSFLFDIFTAAKVYLSAYLIGIVFGLASVLKAFDRDTRLALLGIPLAFSFPLFYGFHAYLTSIVLLLFCIASFECYLQERVGMSRFRELGFQTALLTLLVYFSHMMGFALALAAMMFLWAAHGGKLKKLWPIAPALALFTWAAFSESSDEGVHSGGEIFLPYIKYKVEEIHYNTLYHLPDELFRIIWWAFVVFIIVGSCAPVLKKLKRKEDAGRFFYRWRAELIAVLYLLLYLALPTGLGLLYHIDQRVAIVFLMFSLLFLPKAALNACGKPGRVLFFFIIFGTLWGVSNCVLKFQERIKDFDQLIDAASKGGRTLLIAFDPGFTSPESPPVLSHFAAYVQIANGGDSAHSFARMNNYKLSYLPGASAPYPTDMQPTDYRPEIHNKFYTRIIVHGEPEDVLRHAKFWRPWERIAPAEIYALRHAVQDLEAESVRIRRFGRWALYELKA